MTLSAGELGHRPDTDLQKHVGDSSPASLDVAGEVEKMTLANKLVLVHSEYMLDVSPLPSDS